MIARTMKCPGCKREILEKFTNEQYSELVLKRKQAEKKGIEFGWVCKDCSKVRCTMCLREKSKKMLPIEKGGELRYKIGLCDSCFDEYYTKFGFDQELPAEVIEPLPQLSREEFLKFFEDRGPN